MSDPAFVDVISRGPKLSEEQQQHENEKMNEFMDAKVDAAFERLRGDNLYIWKQSLQLAEKEFSQKGVGQTMNFLPKLIIDSHGLKRTINSLILEEDAVPKPVLFKGALP